MSGKTVSRRSVVGVLGAGAVAIPLVAGAEGAAHAQAHVAELLSPLGPGARFARWTIAEITTVQEGAIQVLVRTDADQTFRLEILKRDPSPLAARPPAETQRFAIYVPNGGDGWSPTHEEQGLAAMTLASVLSANEAAIPIEGLMTHAERLAGHQGSLLAGRGAE